MQIVPVEEDSEKGLVFLKSKSVGKITPRQKAKEDQLMKEVKALSVKEQAVVKQIQEEYTLGELRHLDYEVWDFTQVITLSSKL